jgi:hypothetical protein
VPASASKPSAVSTFVRALVTWMDDGLVVPGTSIRFGWDAILGLVLPGVGDAVTAVSQVALLLAAVRVRAPWTVIARMVLNVAIDSLLGTVPLFGDVFDVGFKSNRKNLQLIERVEHTPTGRSRSRAGDYAVLALAIGSVLALIAAPFVLAAWLLGRLF